MDISPVVPKVDFLLIGKLNYLPVTFVGLRSSSLEMDTSPVVPKVDFLLIGKLNYLPVTFVGLRSSSLEMDISPVVPKVDFLLIGKLNYLPGAVYPPFLQHMTLVYNAVICHVMFLYV